MTETPSTRPFWRLPGFRWLLLLLVLGALGWGGWQQWWLWSQPKELPFVTVTVDRGDIVKTVSANGTLNPVVLVEVLSPSTERYDRGRKFQHYRTLPTLRDVLLVAQDSLRVEQYTWQAGRWTLIDVGGNDGVVQLDSLGCALPLTAIYEQVTFDDAS